MIETTKRDSKVLRKCMLSLSDYEFLAVLALSARLEDEKLLIAEIDEAEQEKMKEIMNVFGEYIDDHIFFDILCSKKFGYIYIDDDRLIEQYVTAEGLMDCMFFNIFCDVRELKLTRAEPIRF